ncbi:hypothetical protein TNCT_479012 [Trichonephila clavata]|uniref:Uncharacterized protein n=1 Tax=Trichonephila clavata TaxID=2740835 RepID=A0A8X6GC77_TRICU|nr:hypothetical protein TNCT_479012 [Trichonephila clavata]
MNPPKNDQNKSGSIDEEGACANFDDFSCLIDMCSSLEEMCLGLEGTFFTSEGDRSSLEETRSSLKGARLSLEGVRSSLERTNSTLEEKRGDVKPKDSQKEPKKVGSRADILQGWRRFNHSLEYLCQDRSSYCPYVPSQEKDKSGKKSEDKDGK